MDTDDVTTFVTSVINTIGNRQLINYVCLGIVDSNVDDTTTISMYIELNSQEENNA